jgi:glycosyltransferase involved in cell wall biosynthesis
MLTLHRKMISSVNSSSPQTGAAAKPLISVIMSVFNGEEFLKLAVKSIQAQTVRDFEFIIVNDGSTDKSQPILDGFAAEDPRIRLISRENRGLIASLNEAAALAEGLFLARMDCDDIAHPTRFELQLQEFYERPNLVALGSQVNFVNKEGLPLGKELQYPVGMTAMLKNYPLGGPFIAHPSLMMRRSSFNLVGGYRAPFIAAEDLDLLYRLIAIGEIDNLDQRLLDYRFHGKNISIVGGFKQMLTRAVLIELTAEKSWSGLDYLSKLKAPVSLDSVETLLELPGLRRRVIHRLVDRSFAYNHHVIASDEGLRVFTERLSELRVEGSSESLKTRRELIWKASKALIRTKHFGWLLKLFARVLREAQ